MVPGDGEHRVYTIMVNNSVLVLCSLSLVSF